MSKPQMLECANFKDVDITAEAGFEFQFCSKF